MSRISPDLFAALAVAANSLEILKCELQHGVICFHEFLVKRIPVVNLTQLKPHLKRLVDEKLHQENITICNKFNNECKDCLIRRAVNCYLEALPKDDSSTVLGNLCAVNIRIGNGCCSTSGCPHYLYLKTVYDLINSLGAGPYTNTK